MLDIKTIRLIVMYSQLGIKIYHYNTEHYSSGEQLTHSFIAFFFQFYIFPSISIFTLTCLQI